MATYYTVKCPHCKKLYERRKDVREPYGSPFKRCRNCEKIFVDNSYIEPGLLDLEEPKKRSFSWGSLVLIALGGYIAKEGIAEMDYIFFMGLGMFLLGVVTLISNLRWKPEEDVSLLSQIADSKKRLSDPHYVMALHNNDCYVTTDLVAWAKKEIGEQNKEQEKFAKAIDSETTT